MAGKRLRRKIRELSGLDKLTGEDRSRLATEILHSTDLKQDICLQCPGITYRDIEKTMQAVLAERKYKPELTEEELYPEKYGETPKQEVFRPRGSKIEYRAPTREEVARLMRASEAPVKEEIKPAKKDYGPPLTPEETAALIRGDYHPDKFKYLRKKKS